MSSQLLLQLKFLETISLGPELLTHPPVLRGASLSLMITALSPSLVGPACWQHSSE